MYYVDTNIWIDLMHGKSPAVREMMRNTDPALFAVPAIVVAELSYGADHSDNPARTHYLTDHTLAPYKVIPFDEECARVYGRITQYFRSRGKTIGQCDLFVAATALAHQAVLVTNNDREFARVPGLQVECWEEIEI
jgi:tRNA(fMet)-specific endonuclease VapC